MNYDFTQLKKKIEDIKEWFAKELSVVRTGRATPALLDRVFVESYGARSPLAHVAGISIEDPRTIRVSPWDKGHIKEIELAINAEDLGVAVSVDDIGIRVSFPELTSDRRVALVKTVKTKLEEARVSVRSERDKVWSDIQDKEKAGEIPEDNKFRFKEQMQKIIDDANEQLSAMADKKEAEVAS